MISRLVHFAFILCAFLSVSLFAQTPAPAAGDHPPSGPPRHTILPAAVAHSEAGARHPAEEARHPRPAATSEATTGPSLAVDAGVEYRHMISPYVYGINSYGFDQPSTIQALGIPITRWGGDATSEYNWQTDTSNVGSDWYFEVYAQNTGTPAFNPVTFDNSAFDLFHANNQLNGAISIGTIPLMGWVANSFPSYPACGYSVKKYGAQQKTDPYHSDCGNGYTTAGAAILTNDPHDTDVTVTPSYMTQWVQHVVGVFGPASHNGVSIWQMDNEPVWWSGVHQSVHPKSSTYDEVTNDGLTYAAAVKAGDPTAAVAGAITSVWWDLFFSDADLVNGWDNAACVPGGTNYTYWSCPADRLAHDNMDFVAWYLQQFANYQQQHGQRLLDYFDIHAYIPGTNMTDSNGNEDVTPTGQARRLLSTRLFWDTSLIPFTDQNFSSWENSSGGSIWNEYLLGSQWQQCLCLIPRMKNWVNTYYPGTGLAISEYYLGGQDDISGVLAQADLLGIFGREGLDYATWWPFYTVTASSPGGFSFRIYRNYDGHGGAFGDIGISATSTDQDQLSIYAAQRADNALTIMVINKTTNALTTSVSLNNFEPAGPVHVSQYSSADLTAIHLLPDLVTTSSGFSATFPAYSMTMLTIPEAGGIVTRTPVPPRPIRRGATHEME
jgi:hypothetical protein